MSGILRKRRSEKGFTLVELMITILIIGILVGIVVMTMAISRTKAEEATCKSNLKILFSQIQQYYTNHNGLAYPPTLETLVTDGYIKQGFEWTCPAGNLGAQSGDYRNNYNSSTGIVTCPRASHNP